MTRVLLAMAAAAAIAAQAAVATDPAATVDAVFARWTNTTPGCAVGVATDGRPVVQRAYGMADLEHDVPNAPDTIFEAGSVSKQFTAAAVLLLARDGKLSIDDPVRKYIPELPVYALDPTEKDSGTAAPKAIGAAGAPGDGVPLTIRHMLTHTSGLRDWGEVAGIAGWPRGRRAHTHAHVLDIVSRQKALNFTPGTAWSYSNTGYNLAAVIVSRVSGQSFADFSRDRIFTPLGMTHTSWRDDYTRIVKHRAIAYTPAADGYHEDMPFENVHGNGGLLTTVGDLLRWNENFVSPKVGDVTFVKEEQTPGRFTDGRAHNYAFGLFVGPYRGVPEVNHSGSTAGYRAFLTRYPDQHVSVAVLCNAGNANATQYAHAVVPSRRSRRRGLSGTLRQRRSGNRFDGDRRRRRPRDQTTSGHHPADAPGEPGRVHGPDAGDGHLQAERRWPGGRTQCEARPRLGHAFPAPIVGTVSAECQARASAKAELEESEQCPEHE
jgi:CubicO group peptidase (beta-lactamase class C family)